MEEATPPPEETWQPVVCRLCAHRFAVLITSPDDAEITLCQGCALLVEWFGQRAAPALAAPLAPPLAERRSGAPVAPAVPKKARRREQLAGLLDEWGNLWRSSQEEAPGQGGPSR